MVFDARQAAAEIATAYKPFKFIDLDGKEHELMNTQLMTGEQISRLTTGDASVMVELNKEAFDAIQKMPSGVGEKLAQAWIEFGGETGKEQSSSSTTESVGEPSSQTSPSEDSTSTN